MIYVYIYNYLLILVRVPESAPVRSHLTYRAVICRHLLDKIWRGQSKNEFRNEKNKSIIRKTRAQLTNRSMKVSPAQFFLA